MMGGRPSDYGDVSVTIQAFKQVPVILSLWRADSDFPAKASVLFDANIPDYLPTEDITILSEMITWKLVKSLG